MDIVALGPIDASDTDSMAEEADPRMFRSLPAGGAHRVGGDDADVPELVVQLPSPTQETATGRDSPDRGAHPLDPRVAPVLISGNLQKKGKIFKGWHQRYFEMQGRHMFYYKTQAKRHCLGEIDLGICVRCGPTTAATFGHAFEIHTTLRTHTLAARTNEEMQKWVEVIRTNVEVGKDKDKKSKKVKRWDSLKNSFAVSKHPSQEEEVPTAHATGRRGKKGKSPKKVARNTSFMERLRQRVQKSPSPGRDQPPSGYVHFPGAALAPPKQRPTSALSEDLTVTTSLEVYGGEPPPSPRSLPATPLSKKREQREQYSSPEHESVPTSPLAVTEIKAVSSPSPENTKPAPPVKKVVFTPEPSPPVTRVTVPVKPVEAPVPEFLQRRFVFDDIRDFLDSLPERTEEPSYEQLPPEEETWLDKPTGVEQLREFLAVCV